MAVLLHGSDIWIARGSGLFCKTKDTFETISSAYHGSGLNVANGLVFTWLDPAKGERDKPLEWFSNAAANSRQPLPEMLPMVGHGRLKLDRQGALWFPCATEVCVIEVARSSTPDTFMVRRLGKGAGLLEDLWEAVLRDQLGRVWVRNRAHVFVADSESSRFKEVSLNGRTAGEGRAQCAS